MTGGSEVAEPAAASAQRGALQLGAEAPFVGRRAERARLDELMSRARTGAGQMALVEGEAGVGKSRLLAETGGRARRAGLQVLRGTVDELERDRPFGAFIEAFGPHPSSTDGERARLARLLHGDGPSSAGTDLPFRIIEAMVALLERLASETPVVLMVEDLHWAESTTLRAVRSIGRSIAALPVLLLTTMRGFPHRPELDRVRDDALSRGAVHLALGALPDAEATALGASVAGGAPGPRLRAQLARAGGNPLFVIELVRAFGDEGAIMRHDGQAEISAARWPATLAHTILRRLGFLPEATLDVLQLASVLGSRFSLGDLSAVLQRSPVQLLPALRLAVDVGLLTEAGDDLAFRHELIRESIYAELPVALRLGLHRQAARLLGEAGSAPAQVAEHMFLGATPGDRDAVCRLAQAARQASARSPTSAVRLLTRARELVRPDDEEAVALSTELAAELAPLLVQTGRTTDAERLTRELLATGPPPLLEGALRQSLGEVLWTQGWLEPAIGELDAAARNTAVPASRRLRARALAASLRLFVGEPADAEAQALAVLAEADRAGDRFARCLALQTLGVAAHAKGRLGEAIEVSNRAVAVAVDNRGRDARAGHLHPHLYLGLALLDAGRLVEAEAVLQAGRRRAEERGTVLWLPLYHCVLAIRLILTGRWDDGLAEAEVGLGLADEVGTRLYVPFLHGLVAWVAVQRGELAVAHARLADAAAEFLAATTVSWRAEAETGGLAGAGARWPLEWGLWIQALLHEARGAGAEALATIGEAWTLAAPLRYFLGYRLFAPDLVRLALRAGEREPAVVVVAETEEGARRSGLASASGAALHCRGLLDHDPDVLLAAAEAYRETPLVVELTFALDDAGLALAAAGRTAEAVGCLDEALGRYQSFGALRRVARTEAALRSLGVRRRRPARPQRAATGWESLTDAELAVAGLAAEGLTNRQAGERLYVSRRTVETHLAHVFRKLGVSTRAQLAAEMARRQRG